MQLQQCLSLLLLEVVAVVVAAAAAAVVFLPLPPPPLLLPQPPFQRYSTTCHSSAIIVGPAGPAVIEASAGSTPKHQAGQHPLLQQQLLFQLFQCFPTSYHSSVPVVVVAAAVVVEAEVEAAGIEHQKQTPAAVVTVGIQVHPMQGRAVVSAEPVEHPVHSKPLQAVIVVVPVAEPAVAAAAVVVGAEVEAAGIEHQKQTPAAAVTVGIQVHPMQGRVVASAEPVVAVAVAAAVGAEVEAAGTEHQKQTPVVGVIVGGPVHPMQDRVVASAGPAVVCPGRPE